jgi:hypothetical protein
MNSDDIVDVSGINKVVVRGIAVPNYSNAWESISMTIYSKTYNPLGFYVYAYIRSADSDIANAGTPYYIGKGKGKRAWTKTSREQRRKPPSDDKIRILHEGLSEEQAFILEKQIISEYGRVDLGTGILRNMSNGGEGPSGTIRSAEFKRKMSAIVTGRKKTPEQRKAQSLRQFGSTQSSVAKLKNSVAHTGLIRTKEHQDKLAASLRDRPQRRIKCPYCDKEGGVSVMYRHHMNNCKYRNV